MGVVDEPVEDGIGEGRVADFELVDDRAQLGAADQDCSLRHVLAHQGGKGADCVFGDPGFRLEFGESTVFG